MHGMHADNFIAAVRKPTTRDEKRGARARTAEETGGTKLRGKERNGTKFRKYIYLLS